MFKDLKIMKTNIITNNTIMRNVFKYLCAVLLVIGTSAHAWATASIAEGRYDLVTDPSTLNTSDSYIIAGSKSGLWAMQPYSSGNNCSCVKVLNSFVTGTPEESITLDGSEGVAEFTLSGSASGWSIFDGQNYYYTDGAATSGQNYLKGSDNGSVANHLWTITSPGGGSSPGQVYVHNTTNTNVPYMHLSDNSTPKMACYNGSGKVYIYKKIPSVTLHDGVGGASTSTIAIGAYFPNEAAEVPGWFFTGEWATSAHSNEAPDYPGGAIYDHGDASTAGTYYAIYQGSAYGCNYGDFSCKPTAIYVLSQTNPSSGVGVNLVVPDVGCGEAGTTITLTLVINEPGTSYQGATIVRDDNGQAVSFTYDDSGADPIITFDLPASDVTATVNFECPDLKDKNLVTINEITPVYNTSTGQWSAPVSWNAVDGATQYGYAVKVLSTSETFVPQTVTTSTNVTINNPVVGTEYSIHVVANNPCTSGNTTAEAYKHFTAECAELEGTLAISLDEVGSTTANLSWSGATTPAIQTTAGANSSLKYDVQITRILPLPAESTGGTLDASDVTYTSWEGTGLTTGATYRIDVTAKNACGETMAASRTFKCKAYEDYLFTCADLSLTDEEVGTPKTPIWISTSAGQIVRSQKALHIEGTGLAPNAAFTFTIGGVSANDCSGTGEHDLFAIRQADYSAVTANASGAINMDVYVFYNPTGATDGLDLAGSTIVATSAAGTVGVREYKSMSATLNTTSVNGRHLPSQFVMAARIGKTWYALPGNITTNATQDPVMIGVNNATNPTIAYCPAAYGFRIVSLASTELTPNGSTANNATGGRGFHTDGEKVKFGLQNNLPMFGSTTTTLGNGGGAVSLWGGGYTYFWTLEHKNTAAENINAVTYNVRTANTNTNPLIRLNRGQWKWGLYSGGIEEIRLLSISPVTDLTLEVMEWGTNEIAVSYSGSGSLTKVQIGETEEGEAVMSAIGGDLKRISGLSSLVAGASGKQCQQMLIQITESDVLKQKILQVPFIINSTDITTDNLRTWTGGATATEQDSITYNMEIVVRPGAKITTNNAAGKFGKLSIYPGGMADISQNIRLAHFTMRGGYSWLGGSFAMPHAKVVGNVTGTGNQVVYDYYIDATKYYDLAVPKTMTWNPVTDDKGSDAVDLWVKQYNGATRASTGKGWVWYNWSADPLNINMGCGYLVAATPKYGRPYLIMRFPIGMTLAADEATKDPIAVTAYGMTDRALNPGVSANNAGWNLIANPFLTSYKKDADGVDGEGVAISGSIATGELVPEIKDGQPTGKYVWDETGGKNVRYVTTYDYATGSYEQHPMSSTTLEPFTGFFIQVAKDSYVKFDASGRQNNIIARRRVENLPDDMEIGITASFGEDSDETILLLCDDLSRDNALEFPDESSKIINTGRINFYTFAGVTSMYANGMSYAEGQEWNAAGITPTQSGMYTFRATKVNTNYVKSVLLKDLYTNLEYDLLRNDVEIYLEPGTVDDRFLVKIVLQAEEDMPTALDEINAGINQTPEKFIYNDKMYILYNGVIYDATGKRVKEINK